MQPFEFFEHTADVGLEARGETLAEAFANAAHGLASLLVEPGHVRPAEVRQVTLKGEGLEDLLVAWLNELLYLFDSEGFLPASFAFSTLDKGELRAEVAGETFDAARHHPRHGVKAATYHQVSVAGNGGYRVRVILDV